MVTGKYTAEKLTIESQIWICIFGIRKMNPTFYVPFKDEKSVCSRQDIGKKKICIFSNDFTGVGEGLPCHSTSHWRLNRCGPVTVTQSSDDSDKSDNINIYLQTANVRAPASDHNLHQFLLLANCSSSDKSSPLHSLQAANSATLVVVIFPDS